MAEGSSVNYSDDNEDVAILSMFPKGYQGTAVDVGAGDGITISNTLLLEEKGWDVLCIEPNPDFTDELTARRKHVRACACLAEPGVAEFYAYKNPGGAHREVVATVGPLAQSFRDVFCPEASQEPTISKVKVSTLNELLEGWPHRDPIDLISIDVDGREAEVLAGLDFERWKPRLVLMEDIRHKELHTPLMSIMNGHGYFRYAVYGWNDLWVRPEGGKDV